MDDYTAWTADDEIKREAGADLLARIEARAAHERARTEALLEQVTSGLITDDTQEDDE